MSDLIEAFKENLIIIRSLSNNTVDAYVKDIFNFESFLNSIKVDILSCDTQSLLRYLSTIDNPKTQNRHLSSINTFYKFAKQYYNVDNVPKGSYAKLQKKLPSYLDSKTIFNNLELIPRDTVLGKRDYAIILFLYATGVRVSELINIKTQDINDNWIKVVYAKGSKQRVIPIASIALKALNEYLDSRNNSSEYLFLNYKGGSISRISIFNITQKYFGVSPHIFRHSYATGLILGGADLIVVSELLGHSNLETTQIYTHIEQKHLKDTIDSFHPLAN